MQHSENGRFGGRRTNAPAFLALPDPLEPDCVLDESVVVTRRGLVRLALTACETASRFEREGIPHDPMAWMLAPRRLFGGRAAIDACLDLDPCMRAVLLHGLSLGLDANVATIDMLVKDGGAEPVSSEVMAA